MEPLIKSLRSYYSYLVRHDLKWQENLKKSAPPLKALSNQAEHMRIVKKVGQNEIDAQLPEIKDKLVSKIKTAVEEEMTLLNEILVDLDGCNRELKKKLVSVEQCCDGNDSAEIFQSSASHPSPSNMIEWAQDSWRLYHMSYIEIKAAMKCLNYEDEESVSNLKRAFHLDPEMKHQIQCTLAYVKPFIEDS